MQIGRHRGGCGHGVRQPEMERKLRRFGEGPKQDQDQRGQIPARVLNCRALRQDHRQIIRPGYPAQDQHPRHHRQPACARHDQRHPRPLPPFGGMLPKPDQQERGQRGQLPEYQQKQYVVRQHDTQHRALEQQQIGEEPPHRVGGGQIEAGVEDDQQANTKDQQREQQPQPVEHEVGGQPQPRQPVDPAGDHRATQHFGRMPHHQRQRQRRHRPGRQRAGIAPGADRKAGQQRAHKRQRGDQGKRHAGCVPFVPGRCEGRGVGGVACPIWALSCRVQAISTTRTAQSSFRIALWSSR